MHFTGVVVKGNGAGTELGFPTANIPLNDSASGIYAGTVEVEGKPFPAAIYADQRRNLLESHLLDFSEDLYGKQISVALEKKLRNDRSFDDIEHLIRQIREDVESARSFFSEKGPVDN